MNAETSRTLAMAGIALALAGLAVVSSPRIPDVPEFKETGKEFYPDFKDPLATTTLEISDWDETTASLRQFSVTKKNNLWIIPSKWDHPADAKERLSKTANAMIDLAKGLVRSDNTKDHEAFGVIDPLETGGALKGIGTRVVLKDAEGRVQADFIFGKPIKEKKDFRFVRLPGQKRVYEVKVSYETSSKFADWVETDLLKLDSNQLSTVRLNTYTIDEEANGVIRDEQSNLLRRDEYGQWALDGLQAGEELDSAVSQELGSGLDDLRIVDVRRKPEGLAKRFSSTDAALFASDELRTPQGMKKARELLQSLGEKGFFIGTKKSGEIDLFANEGEVWVGSRDGVVYRMWFGEVLAEADGGRGQDKESRYLLIRTLFDESVVPEPPPLKETHEDGRAKNEEERKRDQEERDGKLKERKEKLDEGRKRERELAARFADWYYVISSDSYQKLRKTRADLLKKNGPPSPLPTPSGPPK